MKRLFLTLSFVMFLAGMYTTGNAQISSNNNPQYCYNQGVNYMRGTPRDYVSAVNWLKRAYELGNRDACYQLGMCYSLTSSPLHDLQEAHLWFSKGLADGPSSQHYWQCCYQLGNNFLFGKGIEKNFDSALYFYQQARKYTIPGNYSAIDRMIAQCRQQKNNRTTTATSSAPSSSQQTATTPRRTERSNLSPAGSFQQGFDAIYKAEGNTLEIRVTGAPTSTGQYNITASHIMGSFFFIWGQTETIQGGYKISETQTAGPVVLSKKWCSISKDLSTIQFSSSPKLIYHRIDMSVNEFKQNKERFDRISREKGLFNYDPQVIQSNIEDQRRIQEIIREGNNIGNSSRETNNNSRSHTSSKPVDMKIYDAPDYTGNAGYVWCEKCQEWGYKHRHQLIK